MIRRHFTLLEMVLAITIFAFIAGLIGMALFSLHRTWEKTQRHCISLQTLQKIDRVADSAFRNLIPFRWIDDNQKERFVFSGEPDRIMFAYLHRVNVAAQGGIRFITLYLKDGNLTADYRDTPFFPWRDDDSARQQEILAGGVKKLTFSYADRQNNELLFNDSWPEEDVNPNLPLAIQMTVEWENGRKETWLRRTAGNGFNQTLGIRKQLQVQTQNPAQPGK